MRLRFLALILGVPLLAIWSVQINAQKLKRSKRVKPPSTTWSLFTSPDHDFTMRFPRQPDREPDAEGPITLIRTYAVNTKDGMRFDVNFQDVGGDPRAPQNNEWASYLEQMMTDAARRRGQRVVQVHRLAKNIVEMEIWQTVKETGGNQNYLNRSILRRGRVYTLGCGSLIAGREVDKVLCRRFFDSIRFTR